MGTKEEKMMKPLVDRQEQLEHLANIMRLLGKYEVYDDLFWHNVDVPIPFIICNDFFGPSADAESIEPEDLDMLEQAIEDCAEAEEFMEDMGLLLFCARKRKLRPWSRKYNPETPIGKLFHEAGPKGIL